MIVEAMLVSLSFVGCSDSSSFGNFRIKEHPKVVASAVERPVLDKTKDASDMLAISILGNNYSKLLSFLSLKRGWDGYDGEEISSDVVSKAVGLLMNIGFHPSIYPTGRGSIQIEYYQNDDTFAEIEVFEDHINAYSESENGTFEEDNISINKAGEILRSVYGRKQENS